MTSVPPKPKKISKKYAKISELLSEYEEEYDLDGLNHVVKKIHVDMNESIDYKKIRRAICKHATITTSDKVKFDLTAETPMKFSHLRSHMKLKMAQTEQNNESESESEPEVKPVKKGGFGKIFLKNNSDDEIPVIKQPKNDYCYPTDKPFVTKKHLDGKCEPMGTQWIHDVQTDDVITSTHKKATDVVKHLMEIEYPPQRSKEWFAARNNAITASDGGCVVGENHYELPYKFILKKLDKAPFINNEFCYHGKKYETIATMIYEYRRNVKVEEFGLVVHPKYSYLAASPDGIVGMTKADGVHLTSFVGTMLEIKCPLVRKIKTFGDVKGNICPDYYWVQVQLQLECCDLDVCDFWQCELVEYEDREEFIDDTNPDEPFRSNDTGFEKGCVIQLLPKNKYSLFVDNDGKIDYKKYYDVMYEHTSFIYPPKIEMSPMECDKWIAQTLQQLHSTHPNCCFDRVLYWKLNKSHNVAIPRDKKWFEDHLPILTKTWNYVTYLRQNPDKAEIVFKYIDSLLKRPDGTLIETQSEKTSDKIMAVIDTLYNVPKDGDTKGATEYAKKVLQINEEIEGNLKPKESKVVKKVGGKSAFGKK